LRHPGRTNGEGRSGPTPTGPIELEDPTYQVFDRDEIIDSSHARETLNWRASGPTVADTIRTAAAT
jgi:hypothetical protein